ncbi:MAG TPA: hypothetical protein VKT29_00220 [Terriglobales bacterium]|nr:hypothetical protein [Terriglobales bacterium]
MARCLVLLLLFAAPLSRAQQASPPQTPRQALIEMLFSKTPGTFQKHLPVATQQALGNLPAMGIGSFQADSDTQTFQAGSILLVCRDRRTGQRVQVDIDRDDLMGDRDEMDLSFHTLKDGQEQPVSQFFPKLTLTMALQKGIWRLREVAMTLRLPLDDPELLKAVKEKLQVTSSLLPEQQVTSSIRALLFAEFRYQGAHPEQGFTCSLAQLATLRFSPAPTSPPMLDAALASGNKAGYKFTLSGCGSPPAATFQIAAVPLTPGQPAYCADQTQTIKSVANGSAASCFLNGQPVAGSAGPRK